MSEDRVCEFSDRRDGWSKLGGPEVEGDFDFDGA